ncbi:MAG: glycosyltransferase family 2 protein [Magnetococcales bacterium]|nr:glycosyltransferase family 2 protein [Magnetococcales bacterium]
MSLPNGPESRLHQDITLTICLPTFNRAETLRQTLMELVCVREWPFAVEILVSDDASPDHTAAVVEEMRQQHLPMIRFIRYDHNIGSFRNMVGLYRSARGRYATYLADDDRLINQRMVEIIQYLEANSNIVAYFAPWQLYDVNKKDSTMFGGFDRVRLFRKADSLELFHFIVDNQASPENSIFRTDIYSHVGYSTHKLYFPFNHMFRMLDYGDIVFDPQPFYLQNNNLEVHRLENQQGKQREGQRLLTKEAEHLFHTIDAQLFWALKGAGYHDGVPDQLRAELLEKTNQATMQTVLMYAYAMMHYDRDYIAASELLKRAVMWKNIKQLGDQSLKQWEDHYGFIAAFQAIREQVINIPGAGRVVLMPDIPFGNGPEQFIAQLHSLWPDLIVELLSEQQVLAGEARHSGLMVTFSTETRNHLLAHGIAPGRVILLHEWMKNFKIS